MLNRAEGHQIAERPAVPSCCLCNWILAQRLDLSESFQRSHHPLPKLMTHPWSPQTNHHRHWTQNQRRRKKNMQVNFREIYRQKKAKNKCFFCPLMFKKLQWGIDIRQRRLIHLQRSDNDERGTGERARQRMQSAWELSKRKYLWLGCFVQNRKHVLLLYDVSVREWPCAGVWCLGTRQPVGYEC